MLCWSYLEAARDIEVYTLYENKPASNIQTKVFYFSLNLGGG
jgi:hypothetical protein